MNDEKRDYENNGLGRRGYDIGPCPFFDWDKHKCREVEDVRTQVSAKLPTKIFAIFVASAGAFMLFLAAAMITMSYRSLDQIGDIKAEAAVISTRQEALMKYVEGEREKDHVKKSPLGGSGDYRNESSESRHYPTGSTGRVGR